MKPDVACPDGKLLERGLRRLWGRSWSHSGRVRRNSDFTTPLMATDSTPRAAASRTARRWRPRSASVTPAMCHTNEKSPSVDAP